MRASARGDMFVEVVVETPVNMTAEQKDLLRRFAEAGGDGDQSPESTGFFSKVKDLWEDLRD